MKLILLGAPGAGKGTQAEAISAKLSIPQISTGNMLREAVKNGTEMGLKAKAAMDSGELVSDEIVIGILKDRIAQDDAKNGYILDGFPRTVAQAEALSEMGVEIDCALEIDVSDDAICQRMSGRRVCENCGASYHIVHNPTKVEGVCDKCGGKTVQRADDAPETVLSRLAVYKEKTAPLKSYYEQKGKLRTVKGQDGVAETTALVFEALGI